MNEEKFLRKSLHRQKVVQSWIYQIEKKKRDRAKVTFILIIAALGTILSVTLINFIAHLFIKF